MSVQQPVKPHGVSIRLSPLIDNLNSRFHRVFFIYLSITLDHFQLLAVVVNLLSVSSELKLISAANDSDDDV